MFDLAPINLIGIGISLALFYQGRRLVQKRKESVFEFLMWSGFGAILFVLSVSNAVTAVGVIDELSYILGLLGFHSGRDGIFVLSILALLLMLFYTYVNAKTNRQMIYDLNQNLALAEYHQKHDEKEYKDE
jgi:hypothetical protein